MKMGKIHRFDDDREVDFQYESIPVISDFSGDRSRNRKYKVKNTKKKGIASTIIGSLIKTGSGKWGNFY